MFDSNGEHFFDGPEFFDTYVEKMPIGMKRESIFYELPYLEHINIIHLVYLMHIFKNVSYSLWTHISSKKSYIMALGEILFLRILKREIGQENKVEERMVPPSLLKKAMSHGFCRNMIFLW